MKNLVSHFLFSQKGTTSIEYGLIVGLIFLAIVLAVSDLGTSVGNLFQRVADRYPQ
jgi:pilus assembly protein Flp/PilA